MKRLRPSPAMVVATIALIASFTSGAYAAVRITTANIADRAVTQPKLAHNSVWNAQIGRHSVRNINIDQGAVTNRNLAPNSVWHAQIGTGSVRRNNIQPQLLTELQGKQGPAGPAGPTASIAFTSTSTVPLTTAGESVASGDITTTAASQAHLVLNGWLHMHMTSTNVATATCSFTVTNGSSTSAPLGTTALAIRSEDQQFVMVGQGALTAGTHHIVVSCNASGDGDLAVQGGAFTGIATG